MNMRPQRWELWRHVLGLAACTALAWFGVVNGVRVPIVADASYGFHEFGHLMTWFLPDVYRAMMGSLVQVLIPLGLAGYFLLFHHDLLGVALMLGWTGVSAAETSAYVADAGVGTVQISQYHLTHDWSYVLGELGRLGAANELALVIQGAAIVFTFAAMGACAIGAVRALFEAQRDRRTDAFLDTLPIRSRAGYEEWVRSQPTAPIHERLP